jgi:hypothetical protein
MLSRDEIKIDNYYNKYEAVKVSIMPINFKGAKSIMLCFNTVTQQKAKDRLLSAHSRLIVKQIIINQKRMESLHRNLIANENDEARIQTEEVSEMVGEFLGNSQVTLNMVQQMNNYFNWITELNDYKTENFALSDVINYCSSLTKRLR